MAQQTINVGTLPNDGTGDSLRTSWEKGNANFTELYTNKAELTDLASTANGDGAALIGVEDAGTYFTATTVEGVLQEIGANYATDAELATNSTNDRDRANHTGTQLSTTISDFDEAAQDAVGTAFTAGASDGATVTYNDGTNVFDVANTDKGSSQNIFKNVAVATQNTIVADSNNDTLTLANGTGITITTDDTTDTVTVTNSDTGSSAVSTHVGSSDPHTQYVQESILASTATNEGASLVGIEDVNGYFTSGTVEGALNELANLVLYDQINNQVTATYTLLASDLEKVVELSDGTGVTLNLPDDLPVGWNCKVVQYGAGQVTFTVTGGSVLLNRQSHTKTAGQYAVTELYITTNAGGTAATYILSGDTAV